MAANTINKRRRGHRAVIREYSFVTSSILSPANLALTRRFHYIDLAAVG